MPNLAPLNYTFEPSTRITTVLQVCRAGRSISAQIQRISAMLEMRLIRIGCGAASCNQLVLPLVPPNPFQRN